MKHWYHRVQICAHPSTTCTIWSSRFSPHTTTYTVWKWINETTNESTIRSWSIDMPSLEMVSFLVLPQYNKMCHDQHVYDGLHAFLPRSHTQLQRLNQLNQCVIPVSSHHQLISQIWSWIFSWLFQNKLKGVISTYIMVYQHTLVRYIILLHTHVGLQWWYITQAVGPM